MLDDVSNLHLSCLSILNSNVNLKYHLTCKKTMLIHFKSFEIKMYQNL